MNREEAKILLAMFQEHCRMMRHHELQRTHLTNIIVFVAAGLLAFIGNKDVTVEKWPMCLFLVAIGLLGAISTLKLTAWSDIHRCAAFAFRRALQDSSRVDLMAIREQAESELKDKYKFVRGRRLYHFWVGLHLFIAAMGAFLFFYSASSFFLRRQ